MPIDPAKIKMAEENYSYKPKHKQSTEAIMRSVPNLLGEVGKVGIQLAQDQVGRAPQNVMENPLTTAMSGLPGVQAKYGMQGAEGIASLFGYTPRTKADWKSGAEFSEKYLNPQTPIGKGVTLAGSLLIPSFSTFGKSSRIASELSQAATQYGSRAAQTAEELSALERSALTAESKGIDFSEKAGRVGGEIKTGIQDLISKARSKYGEISETAGKKSVDVYGGGLKESEDIYSHGKLKDILLEASRRVANDSDSADVIGSQAHKLKQLAQKTDWTELTKEEQAARKATLEFGAGWQRDPKYSTAQLDTILKMIKSDLMPAAQKHLSKVVQEMTEGTDFASIKSGYTGAMDITRSADDLETAIKGVASGKFTPEEVSDLISQESKLGTDYIKRADELAGRNKLLQNIKRQRVIKTKRQNLDYKKQKSYLQEKESGMKSKQKELETRAGSIREAKRKMGRVLTYPLRKLGKTGAVAAGGAVIGGGGFLGAKIARDVFGWDNQSLK